MSLNYIHCVCTDFQVSVSIGFLSVKMSGSLIPVPFPGHFISVLSNSGVLGFILSYYITFYFLIP